MEEYLILEKWHPMGVSFDGRGGVAIAATSNYGLKGFGGVRILPNFHQPQIHSEWSASTAIYDVKSSSTNNSISYYAAGADGFIYQIDQYGRLSNRVKAHDREVNRLTIGGPIIASASWDGTAGLWDGKSLRCIRRIKPNATGAAVNETSFTNDGNTLACASMSGPITLWDVRSNAKIASIPTPDAPLTIKYSPDDSKLAFSGLDNDVHVWDVRVMKPGRPLRCMKGHYRTVRQLVWLSSHEVLSVGYDMSVRWWDVDLAEPLVKNDTRFTEFVVACDADLHKRSVVVGSWDRKITFYNY